MAGVRINVTASTEQAKAALNNLDGSMDRLKTTTGGLKTGLINFNMAMQAGQTVLNLAKQAFDATAGAAVNYAAQVRDLNRITGTGAEETSRLIQVADDLTISYESLEQAAKIAAKNGIEFTTSKLAEMSAEYQALNPGQERAAYLLEAFGKNGLEMGKWLETPIDKLGEMTGAIDDNMIMTEDAVKEARAFEVAQDNLADAVQGAKYAIGNEMIPVLVKAANALTLVTTATKSLEGVLAEHETDVRKTADTYDEYVKEMVRAGLVAKQFEGAEVNLARAFLDGTLEAEKQDAVLYMLTNSVGAVSEAVFTYGEANEMLDRTQEMVRESTVGVYGAFGDLLEPVNLLDASMSDLTAHMLYNKAAAGLSEEAALALARGMGLVDEGTYAAMNALNTLRGDLDTGKITLDEYNAKVIAMGEAWLLIPTNYKTDYEINVTRRGDPIPDYGITDPDAAIPTGPDDEIGGEPEVPYATGGYIPPGGRGVVGIETVTGMPGGGAVVTNNHNYNISMGVQANENAVINRLRILEAFGV